VALIHTLFELDTPFVATIITEQAMQEIVVEEIRYSGLQ